MDSIFTNGNLAPMYEALYPTQIIKAQNPKAFKITEFTTDPLCTMVNHFPSYKGSNSKVFETLDIASHQFKPKSIYS